MTKPKIKISLEGKGGVLDTLTVHLADVDDDSAEVSAAIWEVLTNEQWTLAPGDTIKISEVE